MNPNQQKIAGTLSSQLSGVKPTDDVGEPNAQNAAAVSSGATQSGWNPSAWKANLANAFTPAPEAPADPAPRPLTDWQKQVQASLAAKAAAGK